MEKETPKHIAIILDGNRRFAKKLLLQPWNGHRYGKEKVEELLDYSKELGITQLTLYCLSSENIKNRSEIELNYLYELFEKTFNEINKEKLEKENIKLNFIGNLELLPIELKEKCLELKNLTRNNNQFIVNFAIAYSGRLELIQAFKELIKKKIPEEQITEEQITNHLSLQNEPDLIIRTGGEKRTSNFLPWQSTYSEWIFLDKMWPEFNKEDLIECIKEFKNRKRNFGK